MTPSPELSPLLKRLRLSGILDSLDRRKLHVDLGRGVTAQAELAICLGCATAPPFDG